MTMTWDKMKVGPEKKQEDPPVVSPKPKKKAKPKEPTDAIGWLKKAYIDNDPSDGAPKVGNVGYV